MEGLGANAQNACGGSLKATGFVEAEKLWLIVHVYPSNPCSRCSLDCFENEGFANSLLAQALVNTCVKNERVLTTICSDIDEPDQFFSFIRADVEQALGKNRLERPLSMSFPGVCEETVERFIGDGLRNAELHVFHLAPNV